MDRNTKTAPSGGWRGGWLLVSVILLLGCKPSEPIRIGFLGGFSGKVADLGVTARDAVRVAIDRRNQSGGIQGRNVILLVKDDKQNPDVARQAVIELISEGAEAIVGPMTSDMAMAAIPIANEHGVIMVSPTVQTEALTGMDDCFFRVALTTRSQAERLAVYLLHSRNVRRVAAAYDLSNKNYTANWLENFRKALEKGGGELVFSRSFVSGSDASLLQIGHELLQDRPDGLLIIASVMDTALLCQQVRKLDRAIILSLSDWGATEWLLELGGQAVEGVVFAEQFDRGSSEPRYLEFCRTFHDQFARNPGQTGVLAHDAITVLMEALARRQPGETLKKALQTMGESNGIQSTFHFDRFGDVMRPPPRISTVRGGQFVVVE